MAPVSAVAPSFTLFSDNSSTIFCESVFPSNIGETCLYALFSGARTLIESCHGLAFNSNYSKHNSPTRCINYGNLCADEGSCCLDSNSYVDLLKIENLNKLEYMSAFQDNWNGVGGVAFSNAAIHTFKNILEGLLKQPQIAPTGRNSLFLQYESTDRSILAFEVKETQVEMVCVPKGDYKAAVSKTFEDNFIEQMNFEVAHFYESERN